MTKMAYVSYEGTMEDLKVLRLKLKQYAILARIESYKIETRRMVFLPAERRKKKKKRKQLLIKLVPTSKSFRSLYLFNLSQF